MQALKRVSDWDRRLAKVTETHLKTPSVWGESDCLLKVADAIEAVTGLDLAVTVRGKYKTELGAAKLLLKRKYENVEAVFDDYFEPVGRLMAQRGDVVTIEEDGAIAAGYVTNYGVAVATPGGIAFRPQTSPNIRKAYKVGR